MGLNRTVAPVSQPVTLAEAKAHCRVLHDAEDSLIEGYIKAATDWVETYIERSLMEQTWRLTLDCFSDTIKLPRGPVRSISSVNYFDADGEAATVSSEVYTLDTESEPDWVVRNIGESWPTTLNGVNAVSIDYVAGFDPLPQNIRHAILVLVGHWFDNRENSEVPMAVYHLVAPYRLVWFGA